MMERKTSREEEDLYVVLGINPRYYSVIPETEKRIEIMNRVREAVIALYPKREERDEIHRIVSIHPEGPALLSTARTIEEFRERLLGIYPIVLAAQTSFEERENPPKNTGKWEWKSKRRFSWKGDDAAIADGFPVELVQTTMTPGSTVTGGNQWVYISKRAFPRNVSFV